MKKRRAPERERVTRPEPERTRPYRSFSTLFGAPGGGGSQDPVSRAVGLGYQVMEEYMRQGQRVASAMSDPQKMSAGMGNIADLPMLTERMFRYAQDFASVWLDVMGAMTARAMDGATPGQGAQAPADDDRSADSGPAPRVRTAPSGELLLLVQARGEVAVSVQLSGGRPGGTVVASELRLADGGRSRLGGVEVERGPGDRLTVRLVVPDDQPPGEYHGTLIDEDTSALVGRLNVHVHAR